MRILTAAVWLAAATWSAEASSILVIDDDGTVRSPSTLALNDGRVLATSPSMLTLGPSSASAEPDVGHEPSAKAEAIPPQPTVIRAGIEGEAFVRGLTPGGAGLAAAGDGAAPAPSAASPEAAGDPAAAAPKKSAATPGPSSEPAPQSQIQ